MERVLEIGDRQATPSEFAFDFRAIGESIARTVRLLWEPSEDEIETSGIDFLQFLGGLVFPLIQAPSVEQFEHRFVGIATPAVPKRFIQLTSRRGFKLWAERAEKEAKVQALYPDRHGSPDPLVVAWREDVHERSTRFDPLFGNACKMKGLRRPSKDDFDRAASAFMIALLALEVATVPSARVPRILAYRSWVHCCEALRRVSGMFHIAESRFLPEKPVPQMPTLTADTPDAIYASRQDHAELGRVLRLGKKADLIDDLL